MNQQKLHKKLQVTVSEVPVGKIYEEYQNSFKCVVSHVNVKRIQANEFQRDKLNNDTRVLQIDYAMAYQCEYQDEVQSAMWTRGSVNLFTCAVTHSGSTNTLLICTDYKSKDKFSNGTFIEYLYQNHIPTDENIQYEIIWSDGPSSEFKVNNLYYQLYFL